MNTTSGRAEKPGGGVRNIRFSPTTELEQTIGSKADSGWQRVSGSSPRRLPQRGLSGLPTNREITATGAFTGAIDSVTVDPEVFSRCIRAYSPETSGDYRFVYSEGWKLNGTGSYLDL